MRHRKIEKINAKNDEQFVKILAKTARFPINDVQKYMSNYANRVSDFDGYEIRFDTESNFVADLIKFNYLKIIDDIYLLDSDLKGRNFPVEHYRYNLFGNV